ncbi:hypothetical protein A2995_00345 [Candidatus Nomurabacteria bacterium RIFCSPLOWO2_01_FULL_33_24]|uniref:DUF5680 domain-containing protein n=1 Tax=Candidatus Nomurabacteria bacterium RIFCSPLOWO2_01_FULL_33_24 TaxID=1801765 RepID=A0A1F6X229_9BACT|nr:MAG: hypothetical protein A2995_00345 [Candidatus Nomurabacteria bacterium RIFCSPLOWO2_01_FULL_33_24]
MEFVIEERNKIKAFFFKSMLNGWASNYKKIKISRMPNYKAIQFTEGNLYSLDNYCVSSGSKKSAGTTTIWEDGIVQWIMFFGGFYKKEVISFLKEALMKNYQQGIFLGGRGPEFYRNSSLIYENKVTKNEFEDFDGREEIKDANSGKILGYHKYSGMSLY